MNGYNKTNAEIGARILELRLKRKMTQEELEENSGICNPQQISNIEQSTAGTSLARFIDICRVLNADTDFHQIHLCAKKATYIFHLLSSASTNIIVLNTINLFIFYNHLVVNANNIYVYKKYLFVEEILYFKYNITEVISQ